ncbi:MAG: CapA family protein [Lachnospiraceae bacterium]|nr:CapA family protein [Lachnospiraceae bacterium]
MKDIFTIMIAGDLFPSQKNMDQFLAGDGQALYGEKLLELFRGADCRVCNLEGALTDTGKAIKKVDPVICAPTQAVNGVKALGIDCVSLANNHILDCGAAGYEETCRTLSENGIGFFGAGPNKDEIGASMIIDTSAGTDADAAGARPGKKVGFYAVAETMFNVPGADYPGANLYDEYRTLKEIRELKGQCDYLIVLYHGGTEFFWFNSKMARRRFHRMAESGADLVIAQHTHCVGIEEEYQGSRLIYGQGDFLFARSVNEYKETGLVIEVTVPRGDGEGKTAGSDAAGAVQITKHLVRHSGGAVFYDEEQDMTAFDERSRRFADGETFDREFEEYAQEKLTMFLRAFRGHNVGDMIYRKIFGPEKYARYIRKKYNEKQILRMISALQFEEFNEVAVRGLWDLIEK